jgi:hypothetical protein
MFCSLPHDMLYFVDYEEITKKWKICNFANTCGAIFHYNYLCNDHVVDIAL